MTSTGSAGRVTADAVDDGGTALSHAADVSDLESVEEMVVQAESELGPLRIAVNNAGIADRRIRRGCLASGGVGQPRRRFLFCVRAQIGPTPGAGGGPIVNMASVLGSVGIGNSPVYVAAKHVAEGVRVNAVGPGFISTPLLKQNLPAEARPQTAALHALGRPGTSEEVANLVAFLASGDAAFITGSYHLVDGGHTAR